ncbi:MAG: glycosyltransferase family 39 protein, partial [Candidatus Harrisonbacteria bacterium]|nr:glycosyltransferase family 39 protein [Candidatus Harrisonbacteria bacterium]
LWLGVAVGLGLLAKYTVAVVVPLFGTYLLLFRRDVFHEKFLWLGALLALAIFSPVILYNIGLYQASGHFDFQLSYIFGQDPDVWKVAPGKEIGTFGARIANFVPRLIATNSWLFLVLFGVAFAAFLIKTAIPYSNVLKNIRIRKSEWFLAIALFWTTILILKIGPSYRFLTMLTNQNYSLFVIYYSLLSPWCSCLKPPTQPTTNWPIIRMARRHGLPQKSVTKITIGAITSWGITSQASLQAKRQRLRLTFATSFWKHCATRRSRRQPLKARCFIRHLS